MKTKEISDAVLAASGIEDQGVLEYNFDMASEWFSEHVGKVVYTKLYPLDDAPGGAWVIPPRVVKSAYPRIMLDTAVVTLQGERTFVAYSSDMVDGNHGPDEVHVHTYTADGKGIRKIVYSLQPVFSLDK